MNTYSHQAQQKIEVARAIVSRIKPGQRIGVGTGSTVNAALDALAIRTQDEELNLEVVPTSYQTEWRCRELGLTVLKINSTTDIDWCFDGADQYDSKLRLIKGLGGALYKEKVVASASKSFVVIASEDKFVQHLGKGCPVPVEIAPDLRFDVEEQLTALGAIDISLRMIEMNQRSFIYFTENGNIILDAFFPSVTDDLESQINAVEGVLENGLFLTQASEVLVAGKDGVQSITRGA